MEGPLEASSFRLDASLNVGGPGGTTGVGGLGFDLRLSRSSFRRKSHQDGVEAVARRSPR